MSEAPNSPLVLKVDNALHKTVWSESSESSEYQTEQTVYTRQNVMKLFDTESDKMVESSNAFAQGFATFHDSQMSGAKRVYEKKIEMFEDQIFDEAEFLSTENTRLLRELKHMKRRLEYTHDCYVNAEERNMSGVKKIERFIRKVSQKTSTTQSPNHVLSRRVVMLRQSEQIRTLEESNTHLAGINQTQTVELASLREIQAHSEARDEHLLGGICDSIATMLDLNQGPDYTVRKRMCGVSEFFGWG